MTNREIDVLVAEKVMGWDMKYEINRESVLNYSTNIADAWKVIEELKKSCDIDITIYSEDVRVDWVDGHTYAETAPMAICKAALLKEGVEV